MSQRFSSDILIIGGGAAGLAAALHLATDYRVTLLSKGASDSGSSHWAQGGIAAVTDSSDSFDSHISDTINAGSDSNRIRPQCYPTAQPMGSNL